MVQERETGIEPATSSLGSWHSTTELHPLEGADALYDSARVPHDTRWDLPLPSLEQTHAYLHRVLESLLARITRNDWTGELLANWAATEKVRLVMYPAKKSLLEQLLSRGQEQASAEAVIVVLRNSPCL